MNTFLLSFLIASVTWLIIFMLELWKAKTEKKYHPPRFVDEFFFQDLFQKGKPEIVGSIHDLPPKKRPFAQPHEKAQTN